MSSLGPFMGQMGGGGFGGGAPAAGGAAEEAEAAPEEEVPKEKTHYDVELTAFESGYQSQWLHR